MARDGRESVQSPDGIQLGDSRAEVLRALQSAAVPLGVEELSRIVGLHANTVRFHLEGLSELGLVRAGREPDPAPGRGPGRPRTTYEATTLALRAGPRNYGLLAAALASSLASQAADPVGAARHSGNAWGRTLAEPVPARFTSSGTAARRQLLDVLDQMGFYPEPHPKRQPREIKIHNCPFREVAEANPEVVCAIHLGMMQGLVAALDAPFEVSRLDPFVTPGMCVAHLREAEDAPRPVAPGVPRPARSGS